MIQASEPAACSDRRCSLMRSNARPAVRTRSIGVISSPSVRIGLNFSAPPIHAWALPIRPPRWRYSSVSTQNQISSASRAARARAPTAARSAPLWASAAAATTTPPRPPAAVCAS